VPEPLARRRRDHWQGHIALLVRTSESLHHIRRPALSDKECAVKVTLALRYAHLDCVTTSAVADKVKKLSHRVSKRLSQTLRQMKIAQKYGFQVLRV
jgi:hypothetical protein